MAENWRGQLAAWLQTNSRTISDDMRELREEFVRRFPPDRLREMTMEEYALGTDRTKDSFCYWLEWKTVDLGSARGGSSTKWGVWWSSETGEWRYPRTLHANSAEQAFAKVRAAIVDVVEAGAAGRFAEMDGIGTVLTRMLRAKMLSLYFPDDFMPIMSHYHIDRFLDYFGLKPEGSFFSRNLQLLNFLRAQPEFAGVDTNQMMFFLYDVVWGRTIGNMQEFRRAVGWLKELLDAGAYGKEERDYKVRLLDTLGAVLTDEAIAAPDFRARLGEAWREAQDAVNNLATWRDHSNFSRFIRDPDSAPHVSQVLTALFDESRDLAERVDQFKAELESALSRIFRGEGQAKRYVSANFISLLLAARDRDAYLFYRPTAVEEAAKTWQVRQPTGATQGKAYADYAEWAEPIRGAFAQEYPELKPDWVDVHSLIWINFYKRKNGPIEVVDDLEPPASLPAHFADLARALARTRNVILAGPPGTGKTWLATHFLAHHLLTDRGLDEQADNYLRALGARDGEQLTALRDEAFGPSDTPFVEFVTFHQSYAYEDFVEGLRPQSAEDGALKYRVVPGVFRGLCERARAAWVRDGRDAPLYALVIDEINRANIAKVFGELITLIEDDKRLGEATALRARLPYSSDELAVPPNLIILGTMNTADRSIALLDLALRRRFSFIELMPETEQLDALEDVSLGRLLERLNEKLRAHIDRDHQIGHSYLMGVGNLDDLHFAWYHRIVPLLQEYFYNDGERLHAVLGAEFVGQDGAGNVDGEEGGTRYSVRRLEGEPLRAALRALAGEV